MNSSITLVTVVGTLCGLLLLILLTYSLYKLIRGKAGDKWWETIPAVTGLITGLVALVFTLLFQLSEREDKLANRELASANHRLAKAQFITTVPGLTATDEGERERAMKVVSMIDDRLAAELATEFAKSDVSQRVRRAAASALDSLSLSSDKEVQEQAERGLRRYEESLRTEAQDALERARGAYAAGHYQHALEIYDSLLKQFNYSALRELDVAALRVAQEFAKADDAKKAAEQFEIVIRRFLKSEN
jgi:tetratricopeptide (TPR) repeat protein